MELGHDLLEIALTIQSDPNAFRNIEFHYKPAKAFVDDLLYYHWLFGRQMWTCIGLLTALCVFLLCSIIIRAIHRSSGTVRTANESSMNHGE